MSLDLLRYFLDDFSHSWFIPADNVARLARALGLLLLLASFMPGSWVRSIIRIKRSYFLSSAAILAALGSCAYGYFYLRGGPRIVDGATYYLQARSLSQGHFTWPLEEPSASYRGRFLYAHEGRIGGIFPPGYPLLLAIGFLLGHPMLIGPLLAAAITVLVYALALELARDLPRRVHEPIARGAVLFSLFSFTQRYHTADTMSHGAVALGAGLALFYALRGSRTKSSKLFLVAGLCVGYVVSARPVSAMPIGVVVGLITIASQVRLSGLALLGVGMIPGVALLLASQHAVTGHAFESTQLAYYARSDGPPGCFRYGFGKGIGCVFEHGDFVHNRLQDGHTLAAAIETTVWRIKSHMLEPLNVELLAVVLVPFAMLHALYRRTTRLPLLLIALQFCAYLPFYFDGVYPGGGARFYADILPVEHVLLALPLGFTKNPRLTTRLTILVLGLAFVGFAYRGSRDHGYLRDRDGGRPAFQAEAIAEAHVDHGLLFVDGDATFGIAYIAGVKADSGLAVARCKGGAHDYHLWRKLGSPPSYYYRFGEKSPSLEPYTPKATDRFESENEWPPVAQSGGYAAPSWPWCASDHSALILYPHLSGHASATIEVPIFEAGKYRITPQIVDRGQRAKATLELRKDNGTSIGKWSWSDSAAEETCVSLSSIEVELPAGSHTAELQAQGGEAGLDAIDIVRIP